MSQSNDKELKNIEERIKADEKASEELIALYRSALEDIEKEISYFYIQYATKEGLSVSEAKKRADQMDVVAFANQAKEYVDNRDFSDKANKELRLYNLKQKVSRLTLLRMKINQRINDLQQQVEDYMTEYQNKEIEEEVRRQAGVLGYSSNLQDEALLKKLIDETDIERFSPRIWSDRDKLAKEVDRLVKKGILQGKHPLKLFNELQKAMDSSAYNAKRVMLTEMARKQIEMQLENLKNLDVKYYTIVGEPKACSSCRWWFGKKLNLKNFDPTATAPPFHPHCRCGVRPWEDEDNELTDDEDNALFDYTMYDAYPINDGLRMGMLPKELEDKVRHIENALSKLPKYKGDSPLKRDLFFDNQDDYNRFIETLKGTKGYREDGFCSTSHPKGEYEGEGLNGKRPDVRIYIDKWKSGVGIQDFSKFKDEGEVLFPPGTEFKINEWYKEDGTLILRGEEL